MEKKPKWYVLAQRNQDFYESEEYDQAIEQMVRDYNNSTGPERENLANQLQKWVTRKSTNEIMLKQHRQEPTP